MKAKCLSLLLLVAALFSSSCKDGSVEQPNVSLTNKRSDVQVLEKGISLDSAGHLRKMGPDSLVGDPPPRDRDQW